MDFIASVLEYLVPCFGLEKVELLERPIKVNAIKNLSGFY